MTEVEVVTAQTPAAPQAPAEAATNAAVEAHITGAPLEKSTPMFDKAAVLHRRAEAEQETGDDWRDTTNLAPMPDAPRIEQTEVDRAIAKLNSRSFEHAALASEWGSGFGEEWGYARAAFKEVAASDPDLIAKVEASGLGDHPAVLKFLAKQGRLAAGLMNETTRSAPMPINRSSTPTGPAGDHRGSEETRTELARMMRENPPGSARYKEPHIQSRIQQLHRTIAGSGSNIVGVGGRRA